MTKCEPTPIAKLRPGIPRDLTAICLKCLEKELRRRYASAFDLAADLRRFLAGEPTRARTLNPGERLLRWTNRRPAAAALLGVSLLSVATVFAIALWYNGRLSRLLRDSEAQRQRAEASEQLALEREDLAMEHVYASRIATAQDAWLQGNMSDVEQILADLSPVAGQGDRRSIEWYYLKGLLNNASTTLSGHSGQVAAISYSPDGTMIASGGKDGHIRLWDSCAHAVTRIWDLGEKNEINAVAFSPDGATLAAATDNEAVSLLNVKSGKAIGSLDGHRGWLADVTFSPDGQFVATAGSDKTARIWNAKTRLVTTVLSGHGDIVRGVRFVLGGAFVATTSEDHVLRVWNVATAACLHAERMRILQAHENARPTSLAVSLDGKALAVCHGPIGIWSVASPTAIKPLDLLEEHDLRCVVFSRDGRSLLIGTEDAKVIEWDIARRTRVAIHRGHRKQVLGIAASPRTDEIATASRDGDVRIWNAKLGQSFQTLAKLPWVPDGFDLSPHGDLIVVKGVRGEFALLDAATGELRQRLVDSSVGLGGVSLFSDGRRFLTDSAGHGCRVWDIAAGRVIRNFPDLCCPNGRAMAAVDANTFLASTNDRLDLINFETREGLARLQFPSTISCLAYTPDGSHLAVGGHRGEIWICDAHHLQVERQLAGHRDRVDWFAFAHHQPWLCTRGDDYSVRLWDWQAARSIRTFAVRSGSEAPVEFVPDDRCVIGTSGDSAILAWNTTTGRRTLTWQLPGNDDLPFARVSRDGGKIYVLCRFRDKGTGAIYVIHIGVQDSLDRL